MSAQDSTRLAPVTVYSLTPRDGVLHVTTLPQPTPGPLPDGVMAMIAVQIAPGADLAEVGAVIVSIGRRVAGDASNLVVESTYTKRPRGDA